MIYYRSIFHRYILKYFFLWNLLVFFALSFIVVVFNLIELIRRSQNHASVHFSHLFKMTFLQLPSILDQLSPLVILFATMIFLWVLHRRSEIIVMRALGYSIWSLLAPMIFGVLIYSILYFGFLNSLSASLKEAHIQYQDRIFQKEKNLSSVSKSGLWLRHQKSKGEYSIIHIERLLDHNIFGRSVIYDFDSEGLFIRRFDVEKIYIYPEKWALEHPSITESNDIEKPSENIVLDIRLTLEKIQQTFQTPASLSFWQLPKFISLIEKTGLSGTEHSLYFFNLLMKPFLLISMIFIGGVCAFASLRRHDSLLFFLSGIVAGFSLHFLHQIFYAFGESLKIPLFFASLIPTFISLLIGLIILMHLEEG